MQLDKYSPHRNCRGGLIVGGGGGKFLFQNSQGGGKLCIFEFLSTRAVQKNCFFIILFLFLFNSTIYVQKRPNFGQNFRKSVNYPPYYYGGEGNEMFRVMYDV